MRKGKEGFIGAEEPVFEGRCFRPEASVGTPRPAGSLREACGAAKEGGKRRLRFKAETD